MSTLKAYLTPQRIQELARPSNLEYGTAIYNRGGVDIIQQSDNMAEAKVGGLDGTVAEGGSQRRRTVLELNGGKLAWTCTESAKSDLIFCKHCVALALALQR